MPCYHRIIQVVTGELDKLPEGSTFVYVDVGGRDYWKNKSNEFRYDQSIISQSMGHRLWPSSQYSSMKLIKLDKN